MLPSQKYWYRVKGCLQNRNPKVCTLHWSHNSHVRAGKNWEIRSLLLLICPWRTAKLLYNFPKKTLHTAKSSLSCTTKGGVSSQRKHFRLCNTTSVCSWGSYFICPYLWNEEHSIYLIHTIDGWRLSNLCTFLTSVRTAEMAKHTHKVSLCCT